MSKAVIEEPAWPQLDMKAITIIRKYAGELHIERGVEEFLGNTFNAIYYNVITAVPPFIQVAHAVTSDDYDPEVTTMTLFNELKTSFDAGKVFFPDATAWVVDIPLYQEVLTSEYLHDGLKQLVYLVRSKPDLDVLIAEAGRIISRIVGMRMKVVVMGQKPVLTANTIFAHYDVA